MAKTLQICSSRKPRALRKLQIWQSWLVLSDDSVTWSKMWVSGAGYVKIWWPKTGYVFLGHLVRCGWSHVPWGACGDYTVCLHEAQPEIKLLAFPIMATAPWRHEGLPVWQISQCLVRIRRCRVSFGSLPCRCFNAVPFPSHPCLGSWAGEMVPCPASGVAKSSGPRRHVILYQRRHGADSRPGKLE